jgi:hypothetical protein
MPPVCPHETVNAKNNRRQHQKPKFIHPNISIARRLLDAISRRRSPPVRLPRSHCIAYEEAGREDYTHSRKHSHHATITPFGERPITLGKLT